MGVLVFVSRFLPFFGFLNTPKVVGCCLHEGTYCLFLHRRRRAVVMREAHEYCDDLFMNQSCWKSMVDLHCSDREITCGQMFTYNDGDAKIMLD